MSVLPDVLAPGLDLVICGSEPGYESARRKQYYAHPQNKFWPILHETGLTPRLLRPEEYLELLTWGIGLTDMVKSKAGLDKDLGTGDNDLEGLRRKMLRFQPKILCFNGKCSGQVFLGKKEVSYGIQEERSLGETKIFIAPSTSPAANRYWNQALWRELALLVGKKK